MGEVVDEGVGEGGVAQDGFECGLDIRVIRIDIHASHRFPITQKISIPRGPIGRPNIPNQPLKHALKPPQLPNNPFIPFPIANSIIQQANLLIKIIQCSIIVIKTFKFYARIRV